MPDITLPDGTIATFPDSMSVAQVEAVLRQHYGAPPAELADGETLQRPNGASIRYSGEFGLYFVRNCVGAAAGWRTTLPEAVEHADAQRPPPPPRITPPKPAPEPAFTERDMENHIREQVAVDIRRTRAAIRKQEEQEARKQHPWARPRGKRR